jgi:predicted NBD/HSP70 family sugar kinase
LGWIQEIGPPENWMTAWHLPDWERPESWTRDHGIVQRWIDAAGRALSHAVLNAAALTEARAAIIDGPFPRPVHETLLASVRRHLAALPAAGIERPTILRGSLGPVSRALGGASLPLFDLFEAPGAIASGAARAT